MLDESQIQKIRSDMAVGYLEALARQLDNGNAVTMDVTASEAAAFHERAFDANRLGIENWTLDIPFKLLEKNGGPAAVERYWRGMLETRGTGVDALVANTSTYALVLGATYSKDPETRALAQQWLNTVPGIASGPAIGGLGNAILRLVKEGHIDPLATDMKQMLRDMGGQLDRLMDRLSISETSGPVAVGEQLASQGVLATQVAGGAGAMDGFDPAQEALALEIRARQARAASWADLLEDRYGEGVSLQAIGDDTQVLVDGQGGALALVLTGRGADISLLDVRQGEVVTVDHEGQVSDTGLADEEARQPQDSEAGARAEQTRAAADAVALLNSIVGLSNWEQMSELQRTSALAGIYNALDRMTGGELPGDLGTATSVLGLLNALEQGDAGRAIVSGVSLVDSVAGGAASSQIGAALGIEAGNVVPVLGLALAVESGDTLAMVAAAANFIPVYGQIISICITLFGSFFADDDIPMREGLAHAQWDAQGHANVVTDLDAEGGGATATDWMRSLVNGLQAQLSATRGADGKPIYGMVPNLLPAIGFQYDPDGFNLKNGAKGFLYLRWTDEDGQTQTRYYDGAGQRGDGSGETLAGDFVERAMSAVAPAWQVETVLAHWQRDGVVEMPGMAVAQGAGDGASQRLEVLGTSQAGASLREALVDVDGDGYLERTQWAAADEEMLAIDADGDGRIDARELLTTRPGAYGNSLGWLDANVDEVLDLSDPAFSALRV